VPLFRTTMITTTARQTLNGAKKLDNYEKGLLFEKFIKNLFNQKNFRIKRWRKSELIPPDTFISDLKNPDLELIFTRGNHYTFAVECKWRKQFLYGGIDWADKDKI